MAPANTKPAPHGPDLESLRPDLAKLTDLLKAHAPYDGAFDLRLPGVHITRACRINKEFHHAVQRPALCLVAQGAKRVMLGQDIFDYDAARMLVYSVDVPIAAQVTEATLDKPFLGFRLDLEPSRIADLTAKVYPHGLPQRGEGRAICVDQVDVHVI